MGFFIVFHVVLLIHVFYCSNYIFDYRSAQIPLGIINRPHIYQTPFHNMKISEVQNICGIKVSQNTQWVCTKSTV